MKYAILTERGEIQRLYDVDPDHRDTTPLSNTRAAKAAGHLAENMRAFLHEGEVITRAEVVASGKRMVWNDDTGKYDLPDLERAVPAEVTNYQLKQALNAAPADRSAVESLIAASEDQNMIDGWQHAAAFKRDHALFTGAVNSLGWSQEKVDQLLILAATFA